MELGGLWWTNVLNLALPPQRHSPDAWLEHQEPVIHTAQNKMEKERKERKKERKEGRKEGRKKGGREGVRKEGRDKIKKKLLKK